MSLMQSQIQNRKNKIVRQGKEKIKKRLIEYCKNKNKWYEWGRIKGSVKLGKEKKL